LGPIGAETRGYVKVVPLHQAVGLSLLRQINPNDPVHRLPLGVGMVLLHADDALPLKIHDPIRVAQRPLRRDRFRLSTRNLPVQPLILEIGKVDHTLVDEKSAASVLVDARARVESGRDDVRDHALRRATHDGRPPSLLRAPLTPIDILAIQRDASQPEHAGHNQV